MSQKIPGSILQEIISFFQGQMTPQGLVRRPKQIKSKTAASSGEMLLAQVFWRPELNKYFIHIPHQEVSRSNILFTRDVELELNNTLGSSVAQRSGTGIAQKSSH